MSWAGKPPSRNFSAESRPWVKWETLKALVRGRPLEVPAETAHDGAVGLASADGAGVLPLGRRFKPLETAPEQPEDRCVRCGRAVPGPRPCGIGQDEHYEPVCLLCQEEEWEEKWTRARTKEWLQEHQGMVAALDEMVRPREP